MARALKSDEALALLTNVFSKAEDDFRENVAVTMPPDVVAATERLFASKTQAYREALVGCAVARVLDPLIDVRLPATELGANSFSGRSLADQAVTPFLRDRTVPVSASPYLSSLRGGARFAPGGAPRIQRDPGGYDALVTLVGRLQEENPPWAREYLRYLLRRFIQLRENANITLKRISKPSLEQLERLIAGLLPIPSGGRIPSFLATALFQTLSECFRLGWRIEFQGINVADKSTGAVGDITIYKNDAIILGVEVTERSVGPARVTHVFDQKVSPQQLEDYLFVTTARFDDRALGIARHYTAVGHEMNFVPLAPWLIHNLATTGPKCRALFQDKVIALLMSRDVPAELKVAWNDQLNAAIGVKPG